MALSPLSLADLHLEVLYERDKAGLLLRARGASTAAADFHLVRTVDGNRWGISAQLSEGDRAQLHKALSQEAVFGTAEEMECREPFITRESGGSFGYRGPAFKFPESVLRMYGGAELLEDCRGASTVPELSWIREVTPAEQPLFVVRNQAGDIVSVCHSARASASAAEAGLETASNYRGRGLAGAVVLGWANAVLAEGRLPVYSTQWKNDASRAVARKLGLIQYGEDYHPGPIARVG